MTEAAIMRRAITQQEARIEVLRASLDSNSDPEQHLALTELAAARRALEIMNHLLTVFAAMEGGTGSAGDFQ